MKGTVTTSAVREYDSQAPDPDELETATFALGCFWGPDARFGSVNGVVRTRVGYAGGTKEDPTYTSIGDHTEAFQAEYDPDVVSYRELLEIAFENHNPRRRVAKTQYQNVVFISDRHRDLVHNYLEENGLNADSVETRIEELREFYLAEDYHQKYNLRSRNDLFGIFDEAGYGDEKLRESPAAAKLNGFASGYDLPEELDRSRSQ
jgi:peptide-methionine (S)-S-oxide reductase